MIYFLEDDNNIRNFVIYALKNTGLDAEGFDHPEKFWDAMKKQKPSLLLLDIMLPGEDGISILKKIRADSSTKEMPVIMLTAKGTEYDKVVGLDSGADDYLAKPFYPEELLARIEERFSMNESETIEEEVYHFGETTFCYNNNELRTRSSRVLITSRQADILRLLAKNIGNVVSKEMIQEAVWGTVSYANSLAVNVQMTYLRHALQHDATVKIESLKKKGYVLTLLSEV